MENNDWKTFDEYPSDGLGFDDYDFVWLSDGKSVVLGTWQYGISDDCSDDGKWHGIFYNPLESDHVCVSDDWMWQPAKLDAPPPFKNNIETAVNELIRYANGMIGENKFVNEYGDRITKIDIVTILNNAAIKYENQIEEERRCLTRK